LYILLVKSHSIVTPQMENLTFAISFFMLSMQSVLSVALFSSSASCKVLGIFIPKLYLEHDHLFLDALINFVLIFRARTAQPLNAGSSMIKFAFAYSVVSSMLVFFSCCLKGNQEVVESAHSTLSSHLHVSCSYGVYPLIFSIGYLSTVALPFLRFIMFQKNSFRGDL